MRIHRGSPYVLGLGAPVLPWILAIARYSSLDYQRKARRLETRERQVSVLPEMAPTVSEFEGSPDIHTMLSTLPEPQREVIVMLKVSGMSIEEVARATSSSVGAVKQKAHRAYEKLRARRCPAPEDRLEPRRNRLAENLVGSRQ